MTSEFFEATYTTYELGKLRKSKFSILLLFSFPPHEHFFNHISTATSFLVVGFLLIYQLIL